MKQKYLSFIVAALLAWPALVGSRPAYAQCSLNDFEHGLNPSGTATLNPIWVLLTEPNPTFDNPPSPRSVAAILQPMSTQCTVPTAGYIDFNPPVSKVSFQYASCLPWTLEAFDMNGNSLGIVNGGTTHRTDAGVYDTWAGMEFAVDTCAISRIVLNGVRKIDDLTYCCSPPSPTPTGTPTAEDTATPTETPADTATPTETPADTATPTETPPDTATPTETPPDTATPTETPPDTATPTETPPDTSTPTATPPNTKTPTKTRPPDTASPTKTKPCDSTPTKTRPADTATPTTVKTPIKTLTPCQPTKTPTKVATPCPPTKTPTKKAGDCNGGYWDGNNHYWDDNNHSGYNGWGNDDHGDGWCSDNDYGHW